VQGQQAPAAFTAPPPPPAGGAATAAAGTTLTASAGNVDDDAVPQAAPGWFFPKERLPDYVIPKTPFPRGLEYNDALLAGGDAARGQALFTGKGTCGACHYVAASTMAISLQGPNLSHVASRHTIAAGLYPNDGPSLARWIKNSRRMKPGSLMWTLGDGEIDPLTKAPTVYGKLTDQEIADIVAYLQALK
jgi:cytochrome c oxidase subunit 2